MEKFEAKKMTLEEFFTSGESKKLGLVGDPEEDALTLHIGERVYLGIEEWITVTEGNVTELRNTFTGEFSKDQHESTCDSVLEILEDHKKRAVNGRNFYKRLFDLFASEVERLEQQLKAKTGDVEESKGA